MRRLILFTLSVFLSHALIAQQPICGQGFFTKFVKYELVEVNNYRNLEVNGIRLFDKGYWVSGFVENVASGNKDFFLSKLNDTGGVQFTKVIGDVAQEGGYCSALPINDGCIISGRSRGTEDVAIISKITNAGNVAWTKKTETVSGSYDAVRGVHMDESKNQILAIGTGMQQTGKANVMILSLDGNGNTLWTKNIDLGGAQHHLNAIKKIDSVYYLAGWAMYSGVWKPTIIQVTESGRLLNGQYADVAGNSIYVDMEVSPSGKLYLLGFSMVTGRQYGFVTCMSSKGVVLWRKYLGYGNSDFGDNLFYDQGNLWIFGQTTTSGVGKREFFIQIDTSGNMKTTGGLYETPFAFAAKINGWPVGRSHFGGIAVTGIDNKSTSTTHFEVMFTNPCDSKGCAVNPTSNFVFNNYNVSEKSISLPSAIPSNGTLKNASLNVSGVTLNERFYCYQNCNFNNQRKIPMAAEICNSVGDKVVANARNANYKYLWHDGDTSASREFTKTGIYWVKTYNDCGSRQDTLIVTGLDAPVKSSWPDSLYCYKGWTYLCAINPINQTTITWENGNTSWSRAINTPGKYWYEINNRCGIWRDTLVITEDLPPKSVLPDVISGCNGKYVLLDGTQQGAGKFQYRWEDGYTGSSLWATNNSLKILKTSNVCGTIIDTVTVVFSDCECFFFVPNAFTPRSSTGKNDGWKPEFNCPMDGVYFSIYSRWGECLIRKQPISIPWDGYYRGDLVQEGVYVYIIDGIYDDPQKGGKQIRKSGTLLVLDGGK
jgi:gliding motility-associated-like protein